MTCAWSNGWAELYQGDARSLPLPDESVHCVVTSPPYWGLRDYGLEEGIGLEPTLGEWVQNIVAVGREVHRVLRGDGTFWLNLGDAYSSNPGNGREGKGSFTGGNPHHSGGNRDGAGLPAKNLMGQPWRAAFALQDDGWILRSAIVWHKPNPMPESVRDRPTNAYEMVFLFSKQGRYFYDAEAVREAGGDWHGGRFHRNGGHPRHYQEWRTVPVEEQTTTANARNVWTIATQGRPDAHFATFPDELPRRCILASTSERGVCGGCGSPWVRVVSKNDAHHDTEAGTKYDLQSNAGRIAKLRDSYKARGAEYHQQTQTLGWQPTCGCNAGVVPATALDPFVGSGTTCVVAQQLGRRSIGIDMNKEYLSIATKHVQAVPLPMEMR